jgi:hypothetical protein
LNRFGITWRCAIYHTGRARLQPSLEI